MEALSELVRRAQAGEIRAYDRQGPARIHERLTANNGVLQPLHLAAREGHLATVERLLAHGADASATDGSGKTPLDWADERGHGEVAAHLRALPKPVP